LILSKRLEDITMPPNIIHNTSPCTYLQDRHIALASTKRKEGETLQSTEYYYHHRWREKKKKRNSSS
jgi:hypothetical protein